MTKSHLRVFLLLALFLTACGTTDRTRRGYLKRLEPSLPPIVRPVVVIPGFGVSRLYDSVREEFVWGIPRNTIRTQYEDDLDLPIDADTLAVGQDQLVPVGFVGSRGPINTAWQLTEGLRKYGNYRPKGWRGYEEGAPSIYPFAYDWRLSAGENARHLDEFINEIRRENGAPDLKVDLVTHSAGGILATTYLRIGPSGLAAVTDWREGAKIAASKVSTLIMIAPPLEGSIEAFRIMIRPEKFIRRVFSQEIVGTWPSVAELLPFDRQLLVNESGQAIDADLHQAETWRRLKIGLDNPTVRRALLERISDDDLHLVTRAFHHLLEQSVIFRQAARRPLSEGVPVHIIAGDCVLTTKRVMTRKDGSMVFYPNELHNHENGMRDILFEPGDGTVSITSATNGEIDDTILCTGHQGLAADPDVHRTILRILRADPVRKE